MAILAQLIKDVEDIKLYNPWMAHHFKKQYGQNFLRSARFTQALVDAVEPQPGDTIIEIGPGEGHITGLLLEVVERVISIEVDYSLIPGLIKKYGELKKFELINEDIMKVDIDQVTQGRPYKVIGSLPYNISKQIIAKFLTAPHKPTQMAFIIQEEVAWEYNAQPPKATFLSSWIRLFADVRKAVSIPASQFFPKPKVNGAILSIKLKAVIDEKGTAEKYQLIKVAFASPRKTLRNNLNAANIWPKEKIDQAWAELQLNETLRPAEVEAEIWDRLHNFLYNK